MFAAQDDSDSRTGQMEEPFDPAPAGDPDEAHDERLDSRPSDGDEIAVEEAGYGYGV